MRVCVRVCVQGGSTLCVCVCVYPPAGACTRARGHRDRPARRARARERPAVAGGHGQNRLERDAARAGGAGHGQGGRVAAPRSARRGPQGAELRRGCAVRVGGIGRRQPYRAAGLPQGACARARACARPAPLSARSRTRVGRRVRACARVRARACVRVRASVEAHTRTRGARGRAGGPWHACAQVYCCGSRCGCTYNHKCCSDTCIHTCYFDPLGLSALFCISPFLCMCEESPARWCVRRRPCALGRAPRACASRSDGADISPRPSIALLSASLPCPLTRVFALVGSSGAGQELTRPCC